MKARKYWAHPEAAFASNYSYLEPRKLYNRMVEVWCQPLEAESVQEFSHDLNGLLVSGCNLPTHIQAQRIMKHFGITAKRLLKPTNSNQVSSAAKRKAKS